jgi:membrane protease YdiL (CAAX protease family)
MSDPSTTGLSADAGAPPSRRRIVFYGPHGLRAGWSLAIFLAVNAILAYGAGRAFLAVHPVPPHPAWTSGLMIAFELVMLIPALAATLLLARIEGRSLATYGFPLRQAFGPRFWEGALWGGASISAVVTCMALAGVYRVNGLAIHGAEALKSTLLWALALLLVGLYEELLFRATTLFTLARGLGFWPAALLLSLYFGGVHYFEKPMETWVDGVSVGLIGLWFCLSVRRTGDVWLAIGWHFAYNFGSLAIFGGPNTGNMGHPVEGHLFDSTIQGSQWLTGGPMGPEASLFIFPVVAAMFWALARRYPEVRFPVLEKQA